MKIGNRVAHFLCDRTVEKWLNFRLSNTCAATSVVEKQKAATKAEASASNFLILSLLVRCSLIRLAGI